MTILSLKKTIEEMRTVYPFEDDKARIYTEYNPKCCDSNRITIKVIDEKTGTRVVLSKDAEGDIYDAN